jgi:phage-related minor tail protein
MLNLSRITDTDVKTVVNDATRLFGDWSIATKDQGDALDYVFRVSQSTGTEVDKLMQLLVQFGAPMRQVGIDFETSATLIGQFNKEGVNTELVLASLRIAFFSTTMFRSPTTHTTSSSKEELVSTGISSLLK